MRTSLLRLRRWPWILATLVLGVTVGLLFGSLRPWAFGGGYRTFIALTTLLATTLLCTEIVRRWHEKQLLLANLWLVLGATQVHADELWTESSFRLLLAFAALSWLLLLVAAFRLKRRLAQWCVWLCNGCLAGAVLFR